MVIITVPKPLRDKLGEEGSDALVNLMNQHSDVVKGDVIKIAEEKFERRLVKEMDKLDGRFSKLDDRITELDKRLTKEIASLRVSTSQSHSSLIRWMFAFWIGQFGMITGLLFAFFR